MSKATVSMEHLYRVFTQPENDDSTLAKIEKHLSNNLADFLSQHVVTKKSSLEDIEKDFSKPNIPEQPEFVSEHAEELLSKLVSHSVNTSSPTFIGHMTSALPYFHLPLSKLLVGLNQNLVKIETSKAFTPLERQTLGMVHQLVFKKDSDFYNEYLHSADHSLGAFCSGGTVANITALWVARNHALKADGKFRGIGQEGLVAAYRHYGIDNLGIISSRRGHYSLGKASDLLGIGRKNHLTLPCPNQTLDPELVLKIGRRYIEKGNKLLAIIGIAGTTETGHVDPLDELADVAKQLGCWFHVDGAWGGATLFSTKHSAILNGIDRADSVTIDAHKQMYVPMGAGMVVFKNPHHSNSVRQHAQYILRKGSKDLGSTTLEGSRNGMAMLLYSSLHILGRRGYQLLIDRAIDLANSFAVMIEQHDDFELVTAPELSILTYRLRPACVNDMQLLPDAEQVAINELLNELTVTVQKQQREAGKSFVSRTRIEVEQYKTSVLTVFRVVLANPLTTETDLQNILDEQLEIAKSQRIWHYLIEQCASKQLTNAKVNTFG
ncbi:MAG: pyridoxal-dependent aspartate 1-decarboxylase PanP [Pseudomonadota bacterium]